MAKLAGAFGKVVAVLFTSLAAPVLVDVAIHDLHDGTEVAPARKRSEPSAPQETPRVSYQPPRANPAAVLVVPAPANTIEVSEVIAHGVGATPDEALQDALRTALCRALAAHVDPDTWARSGPALCANIAGNGGTLIRSWKELGAAKQWRLRGTLHHTDVAVEVNRQALADQLRGTLVSGPFRAQSQPLLIP